jgi:hypothetical protein
VTADCLEIPLADLEAAHADVAHGLETGFGRVLAKTAVIRAGGRPARYAGAAARGC